VLNSESFASLMNKKFKGCLPAWHKICRITKTATTKHVHPTMTHRLSSNERQNVWEVSKICLKSLGHRFIVGLNYLWIVKVRPEWLAAVQKMADKFPSMD
jgi:hypothetical protein